MDIGGHVRTVRKAKDLSQEALARRADVSLNVVSRLERGEITDPHYSTLAKIARGLGMSVSELLETAPKALAPPEEEPPGRRLRLLQSLIIDEKLALERAYIRSHFSDEKIRTELEIVEQINNIAVAGLGRMAKLVLEDEPERSRTPRA